MREFHYVMLGLFVPALFAVFAATGLALERETVSGDAESIGRNRTYEVATQSTDQKFRLLAAEKGSSEKAHKLDAGSGSEKEWKSSEINILGIGMAVADVDGDGKNEIIIIDPSTVYVYRIAGEKLDLVDEYSVGSLALKSVDAAKIRPQGPARIYVSAQNRGVVASLVLELRGGKLVPVIQDVPYFLRVINYPTRGPILIGQKKGMRNMYDGPVLKLADKGDELEPQGRFGVPLKIPVFGFTVGDFEGRRTPLIAVYDKEDHIRIYDPSGKKRFVARDYYGESDIILRKAGPEERRSNMNQADEKNEFFRPRILSLDLYNDSVHDILAIVHSSRTRRILSQTKMLEEGQVVGLAWNGEVLEDRWSTPKIQGVVTDFAVDSLPGMSGTRLITLERKKTDWLAFLKSRSQVRAYDLKSLLKQEPRRRTTED
ncbi:MAG TPA: VCBS repeat-containing protein [Desulfomonilaceae bacterium]|nr:VCBS repeat-containing protein [Desulfomonilaceae bacterium]